MFDPTELDKLAATGIETYVRNCKYGYKMTIQDLTGDRKWEAGFNAKTQISGISPSVAEYHVSLLQKTSKDAGGYENSVPAKMTLVVQETWLTRLSCLAEKAAKTKAPADMQMPCVFEASDNIVDAGGVASSTSVCAFMLNKKSPSVLCMYGPQTSILSGGMEEKECRYFTTPIDIKPPKNIYPKSGITEKRLKAYPLADLDERDCLQQKTSWESNPKNTVGDVKSVLFCIE